MLSSQLETELTILSYNTQCLGAEIILSGFAKFHSICLRIKIPKNVKFSSEYRAEVYLESIREGQSP